MKGLTVFAIFWMLVVACGPDPGFHCENGRQVPDGKFKSVSLYRMEACGVRVSGEIVCWTARECE